MCGGRICFLLLWLILLCFFLSQSKIVRVLNLWQKNGVLPTEVIQPLMDLAKDPQDPLIFQNGEIGIYEVAQVAVNIV